MNLFIALVDVIVWTEDNKVVGDTSEEFLQNIDTYWAANHMKDYPNCSVYYVINRSQSRVAQVNGFRTHGYGVGLIGYRSSAAETAVDLIQNIAENINLMNDEVKALCRCRSYCMEGTVSSEFFALQQWSPCIKNEWIKMKQREKSNWMKMKPNSLFQSPTCGNRFIEVGEECDCGLSDYCKNPCCDATVCKFKVKGACQSGECCDATTCLPYAVDSFMCREAINECDLPEYCDGVALSCPKDSYKPKMSLCDNGAAVCHNGTCDKENIHNSLCGNGMIDRGEQCDCGRPEQCKNPCCDPMTCKLRSNATCTHGECCDMSTCRPFPAQTICRHSIGECDLTEYCNGNSEYCPVNLFKHHSESCNGKTAFCYNGFCDTSYIFIAKKDAIKCSDHCGENRICNNLGHCQCDNGFAPPLCKNEVHPREEHTDHAEKSILCLIDSLLLLNFEF